MDFPHLYYIFLRLEQSPITQNWINRLNVVRISEAFVSHELQHTSRSPFTWVQSVSDKFHWGWKVRLRWPWQLFDPQLIVGLMLRCQSKYIKPSIIRSKRCKVSTYANCWLEYMMLSRSVPTKLELLKRSIASCLLLSVWWIMNGLWAALWSA